MRSDLTVNFHLIKNCNFKCGFCYAHFENARRLSQEDSMAVVQEIHRGGFGKINFAGGEPLLHREFASLLRQARELGLRTSIITNGSRITEEWVDENAPYLDIIGISCDSANPETLRKMGRGNGNSAEHTKQVFSWIENYNQSSAKPIYKKLNSVITRYNWDEDMRDFVRSLNIDRWKIFQVLRIEGENDKTFPDFEISENQFSDFYNRHFELKYYGVRVVPEDNSAMTDSYLMVNPDGRFYCNTNGHYQQSDPIHVVGIDNALRQINFSQDKFIQREGIYTI
ncbi:MAG: viperin family antiviral radical SAM protein [Leptospiraceae bacterium]|nr:viperin family antiviral radical SAM protein [Leptospiraceae bacterium]